MERMVVTGGAGFIGSNLAEHLAAQGHEVLIVDDFSTGRKGNLEDWIGSAKGRVEVLESNINETDRLREAFRGSRFVFHQAAIPSVPRSMADPLGTNASNITGTLSVLVAARDAGARRVVVASSSSIYGDDPHLPKIEDKVGKPLSPYALSKIVCEGYCRLFYECFGLETSCLRYFNVFGPRQDPTSQYSAVIPRFATSLLAGKAPTIYGDGEQTRDFTFVANAIDANWRAATEPGAVGGVFNIGCGEQTSLNRLLEEMNAVLGSAIRARYEPVRQGDVRHSVADIGKARAVLGFAPAVGLREGLQRVLEWYRRKAEV